MYAKKNNCVLKNARFSGKGRHVSHRYYITRIRKTLISYDHTLYSINYGNQHNYTTCRYMYFVRINTKAQTAKMQNIEYEHRV